MTPLLTTPPALLKKKRGGGDREKGEYDGEPIVPQKRGQDDVDAYVGEMKKLKMKKKQSKSRGINKNPIENEKSSTTTQAIEPIESREFSFQIDNIDNNDDTSPSDSSISIDDGLTQSIETDAIDNDMIGDDDNLGPIVSSGATPALEDTHMEDNDDAQPMTLPVKKPKGKDKRERKTKDKAKGTTAEGQSVLDKATKADAKSGKASHQNDSDEATKPDTNSGKASKKKKKLRKDRHKKDFNKEKNDGDVNVADGTGRAPERSKPELPKPKPANVDHELSAFIRRKDEGNFIEATRCHDIDPKWDVATFYECHRHMMSTQELQAEPTLITEQGDCFEVEYDMSFDTQGLNNIKLVKEEGDEHGYVLKCHEVRAHKVLKVMDVGLANNEQVLTALRHKFVKSTFYVWQRSIGRTKLGEYCVVFENLPLVAGKTLPIASTSKNGRAWYAKLVPVTEDTGCVWCLGGPTHEKGIRGCPNLTVVGTHSAPKAASSKDKIDQS